VSMIYSSSPPETSHLVAACLKVLGRKPWVADFRDGWLLESVKPALRNSRLRKWVEGLLERVVVSGADAVVSVSDPITKYFRETYAMYRNKFHSITNGYDPEDWAGVYAMPRDCRKFRVVYTGAFSLGRKTIDPRPFFQSLKKLPERIRENMEVLLIGELAAGEKDYLSDLGLEDIVRVLPQVEKARSLAYQLSADVLLLVASFDKSVATSKLYEYLYAGRPILAVSLDDAAAATIVKRTQSGIVVNPADPSAIAGGLIDLYEQWQQGRLHAPGANADGYSRRFLTQQLAHLFETLIAHPTREGSELTRSRSDSSPCEHEGRGDA
jgi:glycosyltransferase involved in cell wall biosynthesis